MKGEWIMRSWGETVLMLVVEPEALLLKPNRLWRAGEEYAVAEAPPSKPVAEAVAEASPSKRGKSTKSRSDSRCERRDRPGRRCKSAECLPVRSILLRGTLRVPCGNKGTVDCRFRTAEEVGADEA
jgi:hypothetical protein